MRLHALAAVACSALLAGCLAPAAPLAPVAPAAEATLRSLAALVDAAVPLPDGLVARGTVYLPEGAEGERFPVLLDLGPYYTDTRNHNRTYPPNLLYHHFLQRGYAIALVALRGTGLSDGCFDVGGPRERADAAAVVAWLAEQPWSSGAVAMTGVSYDGSTPYEAAAEQAPALRAIVPVEGITDMYRYTFFEGVPFNNGPTFWGDYMAGQTFGSGNATAPEFLPAEATSLCPEAAQVVAAGLGTWADPVHGPFWDERDTAPLLAEAATATFLVQGFQDWNVRIDQVQELWASLPAPKRMLLGQWEHNIPWRNTFDRDWSLEDYNATVTQWLDAYVVGDPVARAAAEAAPRVQAQDSSGRWWNLTTWPPAESIVQDLYLASDRGVRPTPPEDRGTAAFGRNPPSGPYMTSLGRGFPVLAARDLAGQVLQAVAEFNTSALREPLLLMGNPNLTMTVTVDQPGGHVSASLLDEDPAGQRRLVTWGYLNLALREGRDRALDVPVGQPFALTIPMYGTAHALEAGHRLVVRLEENGPDAHPHLTHHPTVLVELGPEAPAVLHAPVFPRAAAG